ncbi:MAG: iron ABC transporter permease [Candidatus Methanoplasma sp.]|jgi:iron complex transport system permease protein|nr:iron ABC transporter permease [Candidatus Methanoplasma sp.]
MIELKTVEDLENYQRAVSRRSKSIVAAAGLGLILTFLVTLMIGNYSLSITDILSILSGMSGDSVGSYIIIDVRVPRLLCCIAVGAALSASGLVMQSLFKNPMASPSVLGISSGAAFGAALALAFGIGGFMGRYMVPGMAFIFCFLTMGAVYMLARTKYGVVSTTLLLAGVAIGAFFSGMLSLLQYVVNENVLSGIVYWTMGSFNNCGWQSFQLAIIPISAGLLIMLFSIKELNLIAAGEEQAANIGVNIKKLRILMILATSLAVGGSVAISGVIGFVGLIVPHIFRMLVGPNHALLIPLCVFGGGIFMIAMDTIAKSAFAMALPVGVLTSLIGAPFFIYVMRTRKNEIWD